MAQNPPSVPAPRPLITILSRHRPRFLLLHKPMKQNSFFKAHRSHKKEHGGALSHQKRRSTRMLSMKDPIHLTLRSDLAFGSRSLMKHQKLIRHVIQKFARRYDVKVYRHAICGNHIHLLIKGDSRIGLQNFFRVVAGHIAQQIVKEFPITLSERKYADFKLNQKRGGTSENTARNTVNATKKTVGCRKNQRRFWALLVYTRIITWGREFKIVSRYILRNTLEALNLIAYKPRKNYRLKLFDGER